MLCVILCNILWSLYTMYRLGIDKRHATYNVFPCHQTYIQDKYALTKYRIFNTDLIKKCN